MPDKEAAIDALMNSFSFATTHAAIAWLGHFRAVLTKEDAEKLLTAAIDDQQVNWIASDSFAYASFTALLSEHTDIDDGLFDAAAELFGLKPDDEDA